MLVQYSNGWGHATVTLATLAACVALLLFGHSVDNSVIYVVISSVVSYWFGTSTASSLAAHTPAPAPAPAPAPVSTPTVLVQQAAPVAAASIQDEQTTQKIPKITQ